MIECPKCGGLNTKESKICGNCGTDLGYHEGIGLIKKLPDEKNSFNIYQLIDIVLSFALILCFLLIPNFLISWVFAIICLIFAKHRNSSTLEAVSCAIIGLIGGYIALILLLAAWGF